MIMRDPIPLKEADKKVVTPFVPTEVKALPSNKAMQTSEDIHVGPNTQLSGGFNTNGMMIVDGRVDNGDISADRLVVSHIGGLDGKVAVHRAEISGVFNGELVAGDEVIIRPTARISGSVQCQKLVIHRGARIECTFSCIPDAAGEATVTAATSTNNPWFSQRKRLDTKERKMFMAGVGSVLALVGAVSMLLGLKSLLS